MVRGAQNTPPKQQSGRRLEEVISAQGSSPGEDMARRSQARAYAQWRSAVLGEMPSASAAWSAVRPAK